MRTTARAAGLVATLILSSSQAIAADEPRWEAGVVGLLNWGAPDTRAGDILGAGLFATYRWSDRWSQSFGAEHLEYDLETPVLALDLGEFPGDEAVDSKVTGVRLQTELEYHWRRGRRFDPYAAFGVGYYALDSTAASGRGASGAPYELEIDTPSTVGVTLRLGGDWSLGQRVRLGASLSYSQTFQDYEVTDRLSGQRGTINAFAPLGIATRLGFRF